MATSVASPQGTVARRLPYQLRVFCIVTLCATALAWLSVLIASVNHLGYPYDWPFFAPGASLDDFAIYFLRFKFFLHHADFYTHPGHRFSYMAPTVLLYRAFYIYSLPVSITLYL